MKPTNFRRLLFVALGVILISAGISAPAAADGLLFLEGVYRQPVSSKLDVAIKDSVATTTLEQTFRNPLDKQVTAIYVAPVPPGATITGFAQQIDGAWVEAEIASKEAADEALKNAENNGQDAAVVSASVTTPPGADPETSFITQVILPPQSERAVRLTYTEVLIGEVGLTRYTYPLSSTAYTDEPIGDLLVRVTVEDQQEIRAVTSPSHGIEVVRPNATTAEAVYRAQNIIPSTNFELVYTQSADQFGLNLASYRAEDEEDGYFMLIAAPQLNIEAGEVVEKDFVFILDRSGSMQGPKFDQAKAALLRILDALNPNDRFTVVAFDSVVTSYTDHLLTMDQRDAAKQWVRDLQIAGGTNINEALLTALGTVDRESNRPHIVVFLTDGQASEGVTDTAAILNNVRGAIRPQSRIYSIGIGDVNQPLLDTLAAENRGTSLFVSATEPIESPLSNFYAAIDSPVLVDIALNFGGVEVYDVYPNPIPDMFLGGQLVITGRYRSGGETTVALTGNINGEPHESTYADIQFITSDETSTYGFVPRLWAQRKVDSLVRELGINEPDPELIEQVRELGMKYEIVTPYTSFVVTDPNTAPQPTALPNTGLPFLYADDFRTVNTARMILGIVLVMFGTASMAASRIRRQ
jgi:Ca-activated chloride channel homolog